MGAAAAGAFGHRAMLGALNAERVANGIPGNVSEVPNWSAKCADHVAYMAANGVLAHDENPQSPAFTVDGSWAGENSVLAVGYDWANGDPFENAPLHLIQLMSPQLRKVGIAQGASGYLCVTTWPGYCAAGWKKPTVYTYPGDGVANVPYAQTAEEQPFVPGDFVGLPGGTTTGFNIMVFAAGAPNQWILKMVSASVVGPHGPVALKTIDRTTRTIGHYLPPGSGFIIPVAPLQPGTAYRASVRFAGGVQHSWRFTTAAPVRRM